MTQGELPTREALLAAAEDLFGRKGFAAVGIREIAQKAGANIAAIKYHFGSKHDLYLQTVRRAMAEHGGEAIWDPLASATKTPAAAARGLAQFIRAFYGRVLAQPDMDACGYLMIREALQPSEAIDAVVQDYLRPDHEKLIDVLQVLAPDADSTTLSRFAEFLLGQLVFYRVFRPIIERLGDVQLADAPSVARIADQAVSYVLRGIGCDVTLIEDALRDSEAPATATGGDTDDAH